MYWWHRKKNKDIEQDGRPEVELRFCNKQRDAVLSSYEAKFEHFLPNKHWCALQYSYSIKYNENSDDHIKFRYHLYDAITFKDMSTLYVMTTHLIWPLVRKYNTFPSLSVVVSDK